MKDDRRRCFECAWCQPDPGGGSGAVCQVSGKPLPPRALWKKACANFEPLDL